MNVTLLPWEHVPLNITLLPWEHVPWSVAIAEGGQEKVYHHTDNHRFIHHFHFLQNNQQLTPMLLSWLLTSFILEIFLEILCTLSENITEDLQNMQDMCIIINFSINEIKWDKCLFIHYNYYLSTGVLSTTTTLSKCLKRFSTFSHSDIENKNIEFHTILIHLISLVCYMITVNCIIKMVDFRIWNSFHYLLFKKTHVKVLSKYFLVKASIEKCDVWSKEGKYFLKQTWKYLSTISLLWRYRMRERDRLTVWLRKYFIWS